MARELHRALGESVVMVFKSLLGVSEIERKKEEVLNSTIRIVDEVKEHIIT